MTEIRDRVAELIAVACDQTVSVEDIRTHGDSLAAAGVTSLAYLRLIDALETEYDIRIDLEADVSFLESLDGIAGRVTELRQRQCQ